MAQHPGPRRSLPEDVRQLSTERIFSGRLLTRGPLAATYILTYIRGHHEFCRIVGTRLNPYTVVSVPLSAHVWLAQPCTTPAIDMV